LGVFVPIAVAVGTILFGLVDDVRGEREIGEIAVLDVVPLRRQRLQRFVLPDSRQQPVTNAPAIVRIAG